MEEPKRKDPMFKKSNNRVRIGVAVLLVALIVAAIIAVVVVVVVNNNKDDGSDSAQAIDVVLDWAKFLSINSTGIVGNHADVTVRYQGHEICTTDWIQRPSLSNRPMHEAGTRRKIEDGVYETTIRLYDLYSPFLSLRISCGILSSGLQFDPSSLPQVGLVNDIPDMSNYTFTLSNIESDSATDDIKIKLRLNSPVNITDGTVQLAMYIDGLNTSVTPPTVFEVYYNPLFGNSSDLKLNELPLDNGIPEGEIFVSRELASYGGILYATVSKQVDTRFITNIDQGVAIEVRATETNEVVPHGVFGLFREASDEDAIFNMFTNRHSFSCFVMGNPLPSIQASLSYPNGTIADVQLLTIVNDAYSYFRVLVAEKTQFPDGGRFTCRAVLNTETQTREITFRFRDPEFCSVNSAQTGLIEQTSENDIVRCTVSGYPAPDIALELYTRYGPDLLKIDLFQSTRSTPDERTVSVNLTITPPNPDIHTLVCVCAQTEFVVPEAEAVQNIVLYPGRQDNYTLFNELQQRVPPEQFP